MREDTICAWKEDKDGVWDTECKESFVFNEGGPPENGFMFCPYCSKKMKVIIFRQKVKK